MRYAPSIVPFSQMGNLGLGEIHRQMTFRTDVKPIERHDQFFVVRTRDSGEFNTDGAELAIPVSQHIFDLSDFGAGSVIEIHIFELVDRKPLPSQIGTIAID